MSVLRLLAYIAVMAGVTYAVRMLPLVLFRREIKSTFVKSFLFYIPYAVLGAMTFPAVFYSTGSVITATVGVAVGLVAAFCKRSLLEVAVLCCIAVFAAQWAMMLV